MTILVFGDSFVGIFTLMEGKDMRIFRYSGSTMRGLGKPGNEHRKDIIEQVAKHRDTIKCAIFVFGNVDLSLSYYYVLSREGRVIDLAAITRDYVHFIYELDIPKGVPRVVLGAFPSPLRAENVIDSVATYGSIYGIMSVMDEKKARKLNPSAVLPSREIPDHIRRIIAPHTSIAKRYERMHLVNTSLKRLAKEHGLIYTEISKDMLDKRSKTVAKRFMLDSLLNIHLRWEPMVPLLERRLKKYGLTAPSEDVIRAKEQEYLRMRYGHSKK